MINNQLMYPRTENPLGIPWEEWTIRWWRWILSTPKESDITHRPNLVFSEDDHGNVVFLSGNFGGRTEKKVTITSERAVLIPIINFTTSFSEEPDIRSEKGLLQRAKADIDDIVTKHASLNGNSIEPLDSFRVRSGVFDIRVVKNNVFDVTPGKTRGVSDGYWLFLRPLNSGKYDLHTIGSCSSGKTTVDSLIHLEVQ
jgi:hypothetical protein